MSFKVSFVYNGYSAEVTSETPDALEMDVIECRTVLHKLPPAIPPRSEPQPQPQQKQETQTEAILKDMEVLPVREILKEKLRGGQVAYKCKGGKYDAYGVMLYPDTCNIQDGLVPSMLMNSVVSGLMMAVATVDGKKRVIAIRKKRDGEQAAAV